MDDAARLFRRIGRVHVWLRPSLPRLPLPSLPPLLPGGTAVTRLLHPADVWSRRQVAGVQARGALTCSCAKIYCRNGCNRETGRETEVHGVSGPEKSAAHFPTTGHHRFGFQHGGTFYCRTIV